MPSKLRPYQVECISATEAALRNYQRVLAVMPTGTGKSVVFANLAARHSGPVLILSHRTELVRQAREHVERETGGEWCDVEQGASRAYHARVVSASVATLRGKRLEHYDHDRFSLIIIDECYHATAPTYRRILDHFSGARVVGFTATPDRLDKKSLGAVFQTQSYVMQTADAMQDGWLVPIVGRRRTIANIKLDKVKLTGGDFAVGNLDNEVVHGCLAIAKDMLETSRGQTIAFFPGVRSAELAASTLNELASAKVADVVSAKTPEDERDQMFRDFKRGTTKFLCNCQIITEGVDIPSTECVVIARPTLSRALYSQEIGRGLRPLPGIVDGYSDSSERRLRIQESAKPNCLVIDYVGVSSKHTLVTPVDALFPDERPEVTSRARKILEREPNTDIASAIKLAKDEMLALSKARVSYSVAEEMFTPFSILGLEYQSGIRGKSIPRPNHIRILQNFGIPLDAVSAMDGNQARRVMIKLLERRKQNLASYKQLKVIKKICGDDPRYEAVSFDKAKRLIDAMANNRWKRPTNEEMASMGV